MDNNNCILNAYLSSKIIKQQNSKLSTYTVQIDRHLVEDISDTFSLPDL